MKEYKEIEKEIRILMDEKFTFLGVEEELRMEEKKDSLDLLINFYLEILKDDLSYLIEREENTFFDHQYHDQERIKSFLKTFTKFIDLLYED